MQYRILGQTGLRVSVVGVGTWQYGGEWGEQFSQEQVNAILGKAQDVGINLIDTAECYGDHLSESLVGKAIEGQRDKWVVATKFGHHFMANFEREERWSAEQVRSSLEDSLRALRTDRVDVLQFHSGSDADFDNDDLWQMLGDQVRAGKIGHLGISIGRNDNVYQTERATKVGAEVIQVIYNRLDRRPEESVFPACERQHLGVFARVPLASGYLSGKYPPGTAFTNPDDVRSRRDQQEVEEKLRQAAEIQRTEVPAGVPMAAWALAWCLRNPVVTSVIPGCKSPQQVEQNAASAALMAG